MSPILELDLIESIEKKFRTPLTKELRLTIGDDCAALTIRPGYEQVVTTDTLNNGVHFKQEWASPTDIGYKCAAVNLSDIAAMGATPKYTLLSLSLTPTTTPKWIDAFLTGFHRAIAPYNVKLIGGNVAEAAYLGFTVTLLGEVKKGARIDRTGAQPGDLLYVTGTLGDAALGLDLLRRKKGKTSAAERRLINRHRRPTPRIVWGRILARLATSMIDISDGLPLDTTRLAQASGVAALLCYEALPFSVEAKRLMTPATLTIGEDYELLFTLPPVRRKKLEMLLTTEKIEATLIGRVVEKTDPQDGVTLYASGGKKVNLPQPGYTHLG